MTINRQVWKLREFQDDDIEGVLKLLKICFPNDLAREKETLEHWKWEFREIPGAPSGIFVAEVNGKIVGHYGCIPAQLSFDGGIQRAVVVVDVMTHPSYRNQGMFTAIGRFALDSMGERGTPIALGFPATGRVKQVLPGHVKVGWFPIMDVPVLVRPMNIKKVADAKYANRLISRIAKIGLGVLLSVFRRWHQTDNNSSLIIRKIITCDNEFDNLWKLLKSQYDIVQKRDAAFIDWRFFKCPHRDYIMLVAERNNEFKGYVVIREFKQFGLNSILLVDMFADKTDNDVGGILLDNVREFARSRNVDIIATMVNDIYWRRLLHDKGFISSGEVYKVIIRIYRNEVDREEVDNSSRWFLTWADFDVI